MLYGVQDISKSMAGMAPKTDMLREKEFWAVDDISFELKRGECLGLIGPNGSGKSTLLKILNGIIEPDKGRIQINGKIGALIEVGAGFHPMLTGRENIYINGSILGFSKKEMDKKFDAIVEFAEIDEFIDTPVKHYSSGMYVRLGFAVAAQMEPDVLLIDEVLAVGDVGFRAKCFNVIGKLCENSAVILVSHAMPQIARVCSEVCVLNKGKMKFHSYEVPKGINTYYSSFKAQKSLITGSGQAKISKIEILTDEREEIEQINFGEGLSLYLEAWIDEKIKYPVFNISFLNYDMQIIAQCNSLFNKINIKNGREPIKVTIRIPSLNFNPGSYYISIAILNESLNEVLVQHYACKNLKIIGDFVGAAPLQIDSQWTISPLTN